MKIPTVAVIASVFSLVACVPPENLPEPGGLDRFESESYVADDLNNENLQGLWIMTTKNYDSTVSSTHSSTGDVFTTELGGSLRMACSIIFLGNEYSSSCYGTGNLSHSGNQLANESRTWVATVTDNTHMTGSFVSTTEASRNGVYITSDTSLDFEMVKIDALDAVIGNMTLTSDGVVESSDINEFYEIAMQEVITSNSVIVSSDRQAVFSAFGNTGSLFGFSSQINGISMMANTINLNIEADSGENTTAVNTAGIVSMAISGVDNNNVAFSSTLDITL